MKVRDYTKNIKEYKGRWTYAVDNVCPCRSCYNAHDCGYINSQGKQIVDMQCATNHNSSCPQPKPEPKHQLNRQKRCVKCGVTVK